MHLKDRGYLLVASAIGLAALADATFNPASATIFLVRKLFALVEYLEFWR